MVGSTFSIDVAIVRKSAVAAKHVIILIYTGFVCFKRHTMSYTIFYQQVAFTIRINTYKHASCGFNLGRGRKFPAKGLFRRSRSKVLAKQRNVTKHRFKLTSVPLCSIQRHGPFRCWGINISHGTLNLHYPREEFLENL